jgi:hypothetical protein
VSEAKFAINFCASQKVCRGHDSRFTEHPTFHCIEWEDQSYPRRYIIQRYGWAIQELALINLDQKKWWMWCGRKTPGAKDSEGEMEGKKTVYGNERPIIR